MRKEDEAFYRRLPSDPRKREKALGDYLNRPQHERLLDGWSASYEPAGTPKAFKIKPGVNLAGKWQRTRGPIGAAFGISGPGPRYSVNFATWDPQSSLVFRRTATLQGGVLVLNRPVFDVVDHPFTKVYVIAMGKGVRLIPSADVQSFEKMVKNKKTQAEVVEGLTFRKR